MKPILCCALALLATVAAGSLQAAGPPVGVDRARVKVLLRRLDADNFFTRQRADEALRALGKPVLPLLREERERTTSFEVRDRLDRMLRDLTYDEEVSRLVRLLGHANPQFRDLAARALRQSGTSVLPLLRREFEAERDLQARNRLAQIITELSVVSR